MASLDLSGSLVNTAESKSDRGPVTNLRAVDVPSHCALFLDIDGTLIDIAPTPDAVTTPDGLVAALHAIRDKLGGGLAVLTGRPIADVDRLLAPLAPVAAGIHGAELRCSPGGAIEQLAGPIDEDVLAAVRLAVANEPGCAVEPKRASLAVHYRLAPDAGPRLETALQRILDNGPDHLMLCPGRRVLEIVPRHVSKGSALKSLMGLPMFRGRVPVMIGDDVTDESAFEAAHGLGGLGLRVAGEYFAQASAHFTGPDDVRTWLATFSRSLVS